MRKGLLVLVILLAGCGAQAAAPSKVTATNEQFRSEASPAQFAAGRTVDVTLVVTGPMLYEGGCAQTFGIWAVDSQDRQVWTEPVPQIACFARVKGSIGNGKTVSFHASWPTSSALAPGKYTIHGLFLTALERGAIARVRENMPPLTVAVTS